jgi:DNA-binding transcriptional LysR family regulator
MFHAYSIGMALHSHKQWFVTHTGDIRSPMKRSDLPNLDDLRAFEATARCGSVRAAAGEMNLTHAAVSRRIGRLAAVIGVALFGRSGRGLRPTSAGRELNDACRRSFEDIGRVVGTLRRTVQTDDGAVLLSCERSVAMRWLIPRLSRFQDAHSDIPVHLSVGGGALGAIQNRVTLALRRLDFEVSAEWDVMPLFAEEVGPVMTPASVEAFAAGDYVALGAATRPSAWDDWLAENPHVARPRDRRVFDHHFLMVEAACSGLGVAMAPRVFAIDDILRNRLSAPAGFDPDGSRYGLLHPTGEPLSASARLVCKWLEGASKDLRSR